MLIMNNVINICDRNIKIIILFFIIFAVILLPLSGQTALKMEGILEKSAMNWADITAFVLEASAQGVFSDSTEAFDFAKSRNWLPKKVQDAEQQLSLNGLALFLMRAFDLKGGIFYTITKSPHYAYRELVYKEIIQGRTDPDMLVSGQDFLFILGRVLSIVDKEAE